MSVRAWILLALSALSAAPGWSTWSVGVIDPRTKTIVVAGASCTNSVYGIAGVVPGVGFVFAQAASNMEAKAEAMERMRKGQSPAEILRAIAHPDFDPEWNEQQYAIVTAKKIEEPATFTGNSTPEVRGVRAGKGISVQGNTLVRPEVLQAAFGNLYKVKWSDDAGLARAVMASLLAGSRHGGDNRCGAATASSAFITVVRSGDVQTPSLNVVVRRNEAGGRNAVEVLAERFREAMERKSQ